MINQEFLKRVSLKAPKFFSCDGDEQSVINIGSSLYVFVRVLTGKRTELSI
jgi:hypothetical protein